jgi:hypothetical protein
LALILCASSANLFLKLLFPVVSLVIIPLGYPLIEANGYLSDNLSLEHLSADLGLALLVAFSPAVLGTVVGFIIRTVGKHMKAPSKTTGTAQKSVSARTGGGSRTRPGSGTRTKTRSNTGMPPLTVKLNTATRARSNARSNVGLNRGVRTQVGAGMRPSASAGTNGAQSSAKARPGTDTVKSSGSRSKKRR